MRVLTVGNMYPPHHQGGYERMWQAAVAALRARGHEVVVLTTTHREPGVADGDEPGVHRVLEWYWADHAFRPLGWRATLALERSNAGAFDALAEGCDLVMWWAMGGMSLSLVARAARRGLASVAVVHDGWPVYGPRVDRFTARWGRALPRTRRYDPRHVGRWSFNSAYSQELVRRAGVALDEARCSVEHPGVDPAAFAPVVPGPWAWRLACVGRVEPRKGVATAVRALAELPAEATLTVVGAADPAHLRELRALADEMGVAGRVAWLGAVDDPAAVYAAADAVLFCVEWAEPFGLVPVEAMRVGRPVVATGTGGSAEVLADGENALLVPGGDAAATAAAVRRLAADPALRERLRAGGAATAERFTLAAFCEAIVALAERSAP